MESAALLEARQKGEGAFPVLRVAWEARGLDLGSSVYSPTMRETAAGGVTAVTQPGGWGRIKYGSGIQDKGLKAVQTSVGISDPESTLLNMLETYDPRGSAANIDWVTPGLALVDWEPGFTGIVSDWARDGLYTQLILKTDDTVLRSPVPAGVYSRAEWGSATENTIFGTGMPLLFGYHDSWQVTHRGMVAATNIRYDKDLGYWWLASVDRMVDIERVYLDGIELGGGWTIVRGVYGANYLTIISITAGYQPDAGVVVSFDGQGMNQIGLYTGSTLTGVPDQVRAILEEYTFRSPPLNGWRGNHTVCEATSWNAVSEFFALHKIESSYKTGGGQEPESAAEIIDTFLTSYPWVRMWWTEKGQIAIAVIDPDDIAPDATKTLDLQKHHEGGQVPYLPGDRREVYTHLRMPFMWSGAEQKYLAAYEAHDVAALPEKVALVTDNPWSQCRFDDPTGTLNPAPPSDPTYPAFTSDLLVGMVSWWDLHEIQGTRVDSMAAYNMTPYSTGVGWNRSGKTGNAASFVASNTEFLQSTLPAPGAGEVITISAWLKLASNGADRTVFDMSADYVSGPWLMYVNVGDKLVMRTDYTDKDLITPVELGRWYHVIHTLDVDADTAVTYLDNGAAIDHAALSSYSNVGGVLDIGRSRGYGRYWDGDITMVGVWTRALTASERTELYNSGASIRSAFTDNGEGFRQDLVAYYKLEETSGTRVNVAAPDTLKRGLMASWLLEEESGERSDELGNFDLSDGNTVLFTADGKSGNAASIVQANSEYLYNASGPSAQNQGDGYTIAGWFRAASLVTHYVHHGAYGAHDTYIIISGDTPAFHYYGPTGNTIATWSGTISADTWYYFAAWWDPSDSKGYIQLNNGTPVASALTTTVITGALTQFSLGQNSANTMNGDLDEWNVWNRTLSAAERTAMYDAGAGTFYPFTGASVYDLADNNTVLYSSSGISNNCASFIKANVERLGDFTSPSPENLVTGLTIPYYSWGGWVKVIAGDGDSTFTFMSLGDRSTMYIYVVNATSHVQNPGFSWFDGVSWSATGPGWADFGDWSTTWHHMVGTYDGVNGKSDFWLDGAWSATSAPAGPLTFGSAYKEIVLGAAVGGGNPSNVLLDETFLHFRVLSADEIAAIYNAGVGRFHNFTNALTF